VSQREREFDVRRENLIVTHTVKSFVFLEISRAFVKREREREKRQRPLPTRDTHAH
jgi:hypothetical protein